LHWRFGLARRSRIVRVIFHQVEIIPTHRKIGHSASISVVTESGTDVLPAGPDIRRAARAVSKKWWRSFGYDYVLATIRAKHEEVLTCLQFLF
jgi:hypothetical protein